MTKLEKKEKIEKIINRVETQIPDFINQVGHTTGNIDSEDWKVMTSVIMETLPEVHKIYREELSAFTLKELDAYEAMLQPRFLKKQQELNVKVVPLMQEMILKMLERVTPAIA